MKKFLLLIALIISGVGFVNAQQTTKNTIKDSEEPVTTILFSDDFEDNDLDGWRTFEKDNDENNWEVSDGKIYSYSYNNSVVLNPDNYIVTTEMFEIDDATNLIWDVLPKNSSYPQDHYAAVISTDNENWIVVWEEILTSSIENTNRCVELAAYEGQSLYIGFRHYDTDGNIAEAVVIDNIILGNDLVQEPTQPEIVVGSIKILNYEGYSITFKVTSVEPAECELTSYDGSPTDIIIPATITFGETELEVTSIGNDAFNGCYSLTSIEIPSGVTSIGSSAFNGCSSLTNISFGEDSQLTSIELYAFYGCSSLTSIEIPSGVTSIGGAAFMDCSKLADIALPQALVTIGDNAFRDCYSLTGIEIPSGVTSIGSLAFWACSSLTSVNFAENSSLTSVGGDAFTYTWNLKFVEFPATLKTLGENCFGELRYVICNSVSKPTTQGPLKDNDGELTIFVPGESVDAYKESFPWNGYEILPIDPASVNVTVNDEEAGSVVGAGDYCKSMEIRLMATPNRGYDFVGWKEDGEIVSTDSDYYFTLYGDRILEAVFELSKYWHPDLHLYPNTMNMITEVKVDGELQNSTLLEVGAFCGDELRGSGRIQYNAAADKYIAYISVMGETDDLIKFKLYDHETYQELSHASLSVLPFETNAIVGTVTEPYLTEFSSTARVTVTVNPSDAGYVEGAGDYPIGSLVSLKATNYLPYLFENWTINGEVVGTTKTYNFVATESVNIKANFTCSQRTELSSGWNWTSFHTFIYGYNGLLALELSLGDYGLHIKNQNSFVTNHNGAWYGSLTSVDVEQMYIIRVSEDFTLVLNGLVVNPENYHITLTKNWKWIGYPVSVEMPVAEAFSGISPSDGDVIKTQGEFAMYNEGIGWSGNLTKMKPGKGYMYYNNSNSTKTLTYPTPSSGQSRNVETEDEITHWTADDTKYPSNMNMVAVLNVDGNELEANYEIAVFAGEELRGNARPIYIEALGRYMVFLTINGEESENLKFKYYNEETDEEFDITENIMFSMNAVVGSVDEPYVFNCNINDEAKDTAEIEVYPNPVNAGEEINLGMTYDKVEIYNAIGAKIAEYNNVNKLAQIEMTGVYVIKATIGGEVKYDRLIVQ